MSDIIDTPPALLELRSLRVSYVLETALAIEHWRWQPAERWAVLGGNGAGKTTLARLLTDELRPAHGQYTSPAGIRPAEIVHLSFDLQRQLIERDQRLDDSESRADAFDPGTTVTAAITQGRPSPARQAPTTPLWERSAARLALQATDRVLQEDIESPTGFGQSLWEPALQAKPADSRSQPTDDYLQTLLQRFGLSHIADRGIRYISTGESRKTLLARALYARPPLLIVDSPLAGLDAAAQVELKRLLDELLRTGMPLLPLVSNPSELPDAVTHLLWLEQGQVRAQGPRDRVLRAYESAAATAGAHASAGVQAPLPAPRERPPVPLDQPLIELRGLNLGYAGQPILTDIHWRLDHGRHCLISGPNGAGKSTLLSVISGDNPKGYGQPLWLFGRKRGSGESVWDIKSQLGLVGTAWQLQRRRRERVLEIVASGLFDSDGLFNDCSASDRTAVWGWIRAAGLQDLAESRYDRLSFGQQRLALIARAMVKTPRILILDEPCLGLDVEHRDAVLALTDRIAAGGHTQVLYVSHRPEEIPRCINQRLSLVPHPEGGYTAQVTTATSRTGP